MSAPALSIELDECRLSPGATVSGRVSVEAGGNSRRLFVRLRYRDATSDYRGSTIDIDGPVLHSGDLDAGATFAFQLVVPSDALPALQGYNGRTWWEVEARAARLGIDTVVSKELDVAVPRNATPPTRPTHDD